MILSAHGDHLSWLGDHYHHVYRSYHGDTVTADLIPGFDVIDETFEDYTRSAYSQVNDSVGGDFFVGAGSTPFFKVDYTLKFFGVYDGLRALHLESFLHLRRATLCCLINPSPDSKIPLSGGGY